MKSFLQWAEENKVELPVFKDAEENDNQPALQEKTKRTGLSANYPKAYVSAQYPDLYWTPIKATAALDLKNMGR